MTALIDTGFLLSVLSFNDLRHDACVDVLKTEPKTYIPSVVLPELAYMAVRDLGVKPFTRFVRGLLSENPARIVDATPADIIRATNLMEQYADARLDFVDCAIIAMAERLNIERILTVDQRDFRMVRPKHITAFTILP